MRDSCAETPEYQSRREMVTPWPAVPRRFGGCSRKSRSRCSGSVGSLIKLDDVAFFIDQEGAWKAEVTVPVKQVSIENVVNAGHVIRPAKDGECQAALSRQRPNLVGAIRITLAKTIEVHGE